MPYKIAVLQPVFYMNFIYQYETQAVCYIYRKLFYVILVV